jgi:hypothetical protein
MPLDINQDPELPQEEKSIQPPVLHTPVRNSITPGRIIFIIFLLVVVASAVFLARTFFFTGKKATPAPVTNSVQVDTNGFAAAEQARLAQQNAAPRQTQPEQKPQPETSQQASPAGATKPEVKPPDKGVVAPEQKQAIVSEKPARREQKPAAPAGKQVPESGTAGTQASGGTETSAGSQHPTDPGHFTIYIAAYRLKKPAEEEVGRWIDAGYQAFVVNTRGRFCVTLGEYADKSEARGAAQKLAEGFENGYWIGTLDGKTLPPGRH